MTQTTDPAAALEAVAGSDPDADLASVVAQLMAGDGLVHGCGCGRPHPPSVSALEADPARWRRIRTAILERDKRRCQVPTPTQADPGAVCGAHAIVAGHVLARVLGGCDHPRNLRAECKPHSSVDGASQGNALRAVAAAILRARTSQSVTDPVSFEGVQQFDPAMNKPRARPRSTGDPAAGVGVAPNDDAPDDPGAEDSSDAARRADASSAALIRVPGPDSDVWDVPWLEELRDVPESASWPRLMTLPHPDAVGSYGAEVDRQYRRRTGKDLRWWQRLVNARVLEHDARGRLVWIKWLLSTARQVGKSTDLRELCWWRIEQVRRWGAQLVLHTGKDAGIVQEVMQPAMTHADRLGWDVDWRSDRWAISHGVELPPPPRLTCPACEGAPFWSPVPSTLCETCGGTGLEPEQPALQELGRWIARTWRSVYGWSPGLAVVDEGWKVPPRAVDDGIWPTLVEQVSPQLGLVSSAHPEATGLMLGERALAIGQLFSPVDTLLLEWSTPADLELDDRAGWRAASPHWSRQRESMIAGALRKALEGSSDPEDPDPIGSFRAQWLNQWPQDVEAPVDPDDVLATEEQWSALLDPEAVPDPDATLVVAVEDDLGRGAAAAAAALTPDGRVVVGGWRFDTLREAVDWCEDTAAAAEDVVLLAGASLVGNGKDQPMDPELEGVDLTVEPAGQAETRDGLPQLRTLVRGGRLAHDGGQDVSRAVLAAKVRTSKAGALLVDPDALLRCVVWVARRAHRDRD
jgi:hypothetical protein